MNAPSFFARSSLAALTVSLCSCVYTNTDPGYGSYGYGSPTRLSTGYGYGSGYGYGNYGLPWGIGGGAYRSGYCNICRHNPCTCKRRGTQYYDHDDHDHHDQDDDRHHGGSIHDSDRHSDNAFKIAGGSVGGNKTKPTGYHSPEWYESRGYDTSRLRLENQHGEVLKSSSGGSKGSSSSSHSSRDRDDHHHSSSSSSRSSSSGSSHQKNDDRNHNNPRFEQRSGGGGGSSSRSSGGDRDGDSRKRH